MRVTLYKCNNACYASSLYVRETELIILEFLKRKYLNSLFYKIIFTENEAGLLENLWRSIF